MKGVVNVISVFIGVFLVIVLVCDWDQQQAVQEKQDRQRQYLTRMRSNNISRRTMYGRCQSIEEVNDQWQSSLTPRQSASESESGSEIIVTGTCMKDIDKGQLRRRRRVTWAEGVKERNAHGRSARYVRLNRSSRLSALQKKQQLVQGAVKLLSGRTH